MKVIRPVRRIVSEADVRKLHEQLEFARRNYRPENGFLLDKPQERLPRTHTRSRA